VEERKGEEVNILQEDEYKKCSLCERAYTTMIHISLGSASYGAIKHRKLILCPTCYKILKESLTDDITPKEQQ